MTPESFILTSVSLVAAIVSLLSLRSNNKRTDAEAQERRAYAEKSDAESDKLKDDITTAVLARVKSENDDLRKQIEAFRLELTAERAARAADKLLYEAEIAKLKLEVQSERAARIEDAKRISALEDELDKREKRIKELESSGTFPAARPSGSGFGTK